MYTYDPQSRILKIQKVQQKDQRMDLLSYQRTSYQHYLEKTVLEDMQMLAGAMQEKLSVSQVKADFHVGPLWQGQYKKEIKKQFPAYYPVYGDFSIDGQVYKDVEVFRLPAMDADGVLNFDGARRVLLMQLVSAERVSYNAEKRVLALTTPKRNISMDVSSARDVTVKYGKTNLPMHKLLIAFNEEEKVYENAAEAFSSAFILNAFASDKGAAASTIADELWRLRVVETYKSDAYALGPARDALNSVLQLDRAKGRILARPVGKYPKGTWVDDEVLTYAKQQRVGALYVQALPDVVGYHLVSDLPITWIPACTRNNERLRQWLPQYSKHPSIPEDTQLETARFLYAEEPLTCEDLELLQDLGATRVMVEVSGGGTLQATFEEEILSNYTARLSELLGRNIPAGRSGEEWVCYYNNPDLLPTDQDRLNTHDIAALYSLCSSVRKDPERNFLLDRDAGLLKKVLAADEVFHLAMEDVVPAFLRQYASSISRKLASGNFGAHCFIGLTRKWYSYLREHTYLEDADTTNPIALIAQVSHLNSNLHCKKVPEKVRLLSPGYFGRICPYETPNGQKLGITNTMAMGAIVEDGILKAPYRRVKHSSGGTIEGVAEEIVYMDAQEESQFRIGDLIALEQSRKGGVYDPHAKMMARVPGKNGQVSIESVDAITLDYVNAFCEQHLSPTAALVPFAGSDDAVRITYATNMLKQAILVQGSQIPRVFTSMYRHCFDHSNTYVVRAEKSGEVFQVSPGKLMLTYDDGEEVDIPIQETSVTGDSVNFLNFHVKEGDRFRAGDILVDSAIAKQGIYSPGVNLLAAYVADGYNYEDAIAISEYGANQFVSIAVETAVNRLHRDAGESLRASREFCYTYIPENGKLANVMRQSSRDARRSTTEALTSGKHSGILFQLERNHEEDKAAEYFAHLLAFNRLRTGDKMAGRHSNKGTVSTVRKNSEMPCFANGRPVDILLNPCGVPSRMNIGQNFEGYLGFVAELLDIYIESDSFNGASRKDIKRLMSYVYDLANNPNADGVCRQYPDLPSSLHMQARARHSVIREWEGCFEKDGTARLYNPQTGKYLNGRVTFGMPYMLKLDHEVNHKFHSRAGMMEEDYSQVSKQPTEGAAKGGGQKMGEMELCAMAAYGAAEFLHETCNGLSDNVTDRVNLTLKTLNLPEYRAGGVSAPYAVEKFRYYLEALGYKLTEDMNILPAADKDSAGHRSVPDVRGILAHQQREGSGSLNNLLKGEFG